MKQKAPWISLFIWVASAIVLVAAQELFPGHRLFPDFFTVVSFAIIGWYIIAAVKRGSLRQDLSEPVGGIFSAKGLIASGAILFAAGLVWVYFASSNILNSHDDSQLPLIAYLIGPALLLIASGSVCLGLGAYFVLFKNRKPN